MSWKEYSQLSKEDQRKEDQRQLMIVRQNALAHATQIVMGLGASGLDNFTLSNIKKRVLETASDLVDWVYGEKESIAVLPLPTPEQKAILDTFEKKYGIKRGEVYKTYGSYPLNKEEAAKALKTIQGRKSND